MALDVVKGQWNEPFQAMVHWEVFYVFARRGRVCYVHFYPFGDDWEAAGRLAERIRTVPDFSPEGKPGVWWRAVDTKPIRPPPRRDRRGYRV